MKENSTDATNDVEKDYNVRLLYWKSDAIRNDVQILLGNVKLSQISISHMEAYRGKFEIDSHEQLLNDLFELFNGDDNPLSFEKNPDAQKYLRDNQLHTSMSTGDVVEISCNEFWVVTLRGWRKLE